MSAINVEYIFNRYTGECNGVKECNDDFDS